MDLGGAGLPQHGDDRPGAGAPHDGVVDHHQALAGDVLPDGVELHPHALRALVLAGGDERAVDVAVADQAVAERDAAAAGVALGRGDARLRHRHDHRLPAGGIGRQRGLVGQRLAHVLAGGVDRLAVEAAVGPGEVDELEQAELGLDALVVEGADRAGAGGVDDDDLAGVELAHEVGADDVEAGRLRRQDPPVVQPAQAERAEAVGVPHADHVRVVHQHQREGALELGQDLHQGPLQVAAVAAGAGAGGLHGVLDQLGHDVAVAVHRSRQDAGLFGERGGVGQVAVVAQHEAGVARLPVDGLGVAPVAGAGRGVADVTDGEVAVEGGEGPAVEDVGHQPHVLDHGEGVAVAHRHARRFLAPVLEGEEAQVRQVGDRVTRCVDPEDPAGLFWGVVVAVGLGGLHLH